MKHAADPVGHPDDTPEHDPADDAQPHRTAAERSTNDPTSHDRLTANTMYATRIAAPILSIRETTLLPL